MWYFKVERERKFSINCSGTLGNPHGTILKLISALNLNKVYCQSKTIKVLDNNVRIYLHVLVERMIS